MSEPNVDTRPRKVAYAAFWLGDVLLLLAAWLVFQQAQRPMALYEVAAVSCCTILAAGLGIWPFLLEQRALEARADRDQLTGTLAQLQRLEEVADRIGLATGQWQTAQEHAASAVGAAREIAERMADEQRQFREFSQQSQGARLQHLELEATKLRRAEAEWLQVTVRILDHVFALFTAAARSGQPQLVEQIGAFQNACRETARRIGLVTHTAAVGNPYDPNTHQLLDPNSPVPEEPVVAGTIGLGYTFQGQPLRRVVVVIQPRAALDATTPSVSGVGIALSSTPAAGVESGRGPDEQPDEAEASATPRGAATVSFTTAAPEESSLGSA